MAKKNGKPSKREIELAGFRVAGYHGDNSDYTRRMIERRHANRDAANAAWAEGVKMKANGVPCGCPQCKGGAA